jgi:hypothetical protein
MSERNNENMKTDYGVKSRCTKKYPRRVCKNRKNHPEKPSNKINKPIKNQRKITDTLYQIEAKEVKEKIVVESDEYISESESESELEIDEEDYDW